MLKMSPALNKLHPSLPFKGAVTFFYAVSMLVGTGGSSGLTRIRDQTAALTPAFTQGHWDRSGLKRTGLASFYAPKFAGRKMADGTPMRPQGDNAASLSLPLGTTALVTNLKTGRAALVTIRDRGPYVKGRIVDLSPATAAKIGLGSREGVAPVEVAPIAVPLGDGTIKLMADNAGPVGAQRASGVWDN